MIDEVCYEKTEAGRAEIRNRTSDLNRSARNLLLIVDQSRPAGNWVNLVQGARPDDLDLLRVRGLIEQAIKADAVVAGPAATLAQALGAMGYDQLYTLMTCQARDRLGLVRGYMFILQVERCASVEELRGVAERFFALVEQHQGAAAAKQMRSALGVEG